MNSQWQGIGTIRRASGEELLLMAIAADRETRQAIDVELERRSKPHLEGRLARRTASDADSICPAA